MVLDEKGDDAVAQTLFEGDEAANAAVAVLKGMDILENGVERNDVLYGNAAFRLAGC